MKFSKKGLFIMILKKIYIGFVVKIKIKCV